MKKKVSTTPVEPLIISRLQRTSKAQLEQERQRALWRQRAGRILLQAVIAAVVLRFVSIAVQPCLASYRSSRDIHVLREQYDREMQKQRRLQAQIGFLKSDQGVEEEARRLGWTRIGEVPLQIIHPEPPRPQPAADQPPVKGGEATAVTGEKLPSRVSVSERIRLALTRFLEGGKK
jgi:hypothetical protein